MNSESGEIDVRAGYLHEDGISAVNTRQHIAAHMLHACALGRSKLSINAYPLILGQD